MKIRIRKATEKDLKRIFEIEKRSYTPQLQATHEVLKYRFKTFGIWVAELDNKVVGFFTCIPARLSWPKPNIKKILENRKPYYKPWFEEYEKIKKKNGKFNTLWVTSTAVESKYQGRRIGKALIKYSLKLAKKLGLKYRASALRCCYAAYYKKTGKSIYEYIKEVKEGKIKDRFLQPYLKLGFTLDRPLPNYEPYKGSLNYNILAFKKQD